MIRPKRRAFRRADDFRRSLYVGMRQAVGWRSTVERRLIAAEAANYEAFEIPRAAGFAVVPPGRFPEAAEIVEAYRGTASREDVSLQGRAGKPTFMIPTVDPKALTLESPLVRFALRPDVLASVTAYLGVVPILRKIDVMVSHGSDAKPSSSQLYHCDAGDTSQVKIFLLCTDVGPENGPLTVMGAETSRLARKALNYQYPDRVPDEQMFAVTGGRDQHPIVGPRGTAGFVDTSRCFHYGSRVRGDAAPRIVALIQYVTPFSFLLERDNRSKARLKHLATPDLPRLKRLVLGGQ